MTEQTKLNTISCQGVSDNTFIISKSFTQFVSNLRSDIIEIHRRIIYMRKDLGDKMQFMPLPVLMLATYDQDGKANVMNAAWGGVYDYNQVYVSLSKHKTTDNLELKKAFTLSFATKKTEKISDYFGVVSGNKEDKIEKSGVHVTPSKSHLIFCFLPHPDRPLAHQKLKFLFPSQLRLQWLQIFSWKEVNSLDFHP